MTILYKNYSATTLAGTLATGATTLTVADGTLVPTVAAPDVTYLTLDDGTKKEIVKVTAHTAAAASMTVVRSQDGTSDPGTTWAIGTICEMRITAGQLANFETLANVDNATAKTTPIDADYFPLKDSASSNALAKVTWANVKATLKTYFDTLYAAVAGSAAQAFSVAAATGVAHAVRADQVQGQSLTAFTTAGVATAFTLTPIPATTANTTNQRFRVAFHVAAGAAPTLAVSGQTAKTLKYKDSAGAKQAISATLVPINWVSDVEYDGTDWVVLSVVGGGSTAGASIVGAHRNLVVSTTGTTANVTVTADEVSVEDSANAYQTLRAVSLTIAGTTTGANALDTGTIAASTWYAVWVIAKADGTKAGLLSTSATAPTMPADYTYKARVGYVRTDGTGNKYPLAMKQAGRHAAYKVTAGGNLTALPELANGTLGTYPATYAAVATGDFVPPTAVEIEINVYQTANSAFGVAPSTAYANVDSGTNPPPLAVASGAYQQARGLLVLESTDIYAMSGSTCVVRCAGWIDNI